MTDASMSSQYPTLDPSGSTPSVSAPSSGGLGTGAIIGIVVAAVLAVAALVAVGVWLALKWKKKRKLEGKYCPAAEEQKTHVKNLPPLPNPPPERLI